MFRTMSAFGVLLAATPALAQSPAEFYKGKSVDMVIGFSVGGGYDVYARTVARFMGEQIPGKPRIVPKQMTGAGSRVLTNFMYSVAPKDGGANCGDPDACRMRPGRLKKKEESTVSWLGAHALAAPRRLCASPPYRP